MTNLKKLALLTALLGASNIALADNSDPYQGWFVGGGLNTSKFDVSNDTGFSTSGSYAVGFEILGGYSFTFYDKFVGQAEAKLRISHSKSGIDGVDLFKEKYSTSLAYLQGYKVTEQFVPYVKLGIDVAQIDSDASIDRYIDGDTTSRFIYGIGAKYALNSHSVIGVEYTFADAPHQRTNELVAESNTFSLTYSYHF
ncbi:outer membrane beta-barrel protein [Lonepinella sp. BR2919]|uniref:outer membrane beta-barrel protein n=1 Tax=unclassified Lonepinella TaxID=2642006 RepID=UPI003F6E35BD